jgi:hypothetical protein
MRCVLALSFCLLTLLSIGLLSAIARGGTLGRDARTVRTVFFVAKSENRNQVHYSIRLDEACAPTGDAPVFAYWRMLERGPLVTEPLLWHEVAAYGFAGQRTLERNEGGGRVLLSLNALPKRAIVVTSTARDATCTAAARLVIGGVEASLDSVFVQLRWPFGVDHMVLWGRAADGTRVRERVAN